MGKAPGVVFSSSEVGSLKSRVGMKSSSLWRRSLRAVGKQPEELVASNGAGGTLVFVMVDQSRRKGMWEKLYLASFRHRKCPAILIDQQCLFGKEPLVTGLADHQQDIAVGRPAFDLGPGEVVGLNESQDAVDHDQLAEVTCKITRNVRRIHLGLLSIDQCRIPVPMKTSGNFAQTKQEIPSHQSNGVPSAAAGLWMLGEWACN